MQHAQADADLMQIRSPIDGVVVLNNLFHENGVREVQEGDQLDPGVTFLQVIDPSAMQVRASVNQEDLLSLQIGQPAKVHLDAYPELVFTGRLEEIAPVARSGFSTKLRTFEAVFSIARSDAKLMPDLSAAVDVDRNTTKSESHSND
jgi:multidrug resistance efflux pump